MRINNGEYRLMRTDDGWRRTEWIEEIKDLDEAAAESYIKEQTYSPLQSFALSLMKYCSMVYSDGDHLFGTARTGGIDIKIHVYCLALFNWVVAVDGVVLGNHYTFGQAQSVLAAGADVLLRKKHNTITKKVTGNGI